MGRAFYSLQIYAIIWSLWAVPIFAEQTNIASNGTRLERGEIDNDGPSKESQAALKESQDLGKENKAHDKIAKGENHSYCDQYNRSTKDKYKSLEDYQGAVLDQRLEQIARQRKLVADLSTKLTGAEQKYSSDGSGGQFDPARAAQLKQNLDNAKKGMDDAKAAHQQKKVALLQAEKELKTVRQSCQDRISSTCTQRISVAKQRVNQAREERDKAKQSYDNNRRTYHRLGNSIRNSKDEKNIIGAEADLKGNDSKQKESHDLSGTQGGELSGTLHRANVRLKDLMNATTDSAAKLAQIKAEKLTQLELESTYNADYALYEVALNAHDKDQANGAMAISNVKVMALAAAGAKDLACHPSGGEKVRSKSYYLFKAAAATYLAAQVNDNQYFKDTTQCRANEDFTADKNDMQMRTVERAANLHEEIFEQLCMRINPTDQKLAEECRLKLKAILGDEYANSSRSRENALTMFKAAHAASLEELNSKRQRVAIAKQNVAKGKKWQKKTLNAIAISVAIAAMKKALGVSYSSICATTFGGWACPLAGKWWAEYGITVAYLSWLAIDLKKAISFTKKWQKKLGEAQVYTHMACNNKEALEQQEKVKTFVKSKAQEAKAQVEKAKDEVRKRIESRQSSTFQQRPDRKKIFEQIEWRRALAGSKSSLPYYISPDLLGLTASKKTPSQHWSLQFLTQLADQIFPKLHAIDSRLGNALSLATGSSSFTYFLTRKNTDWQAQSYDASKDSNNGLDTSATFVDVSKLPIEKQTGFPIPETRVIYLQKVIDSVEDNIRLSQGAIESAANYRNELRSLVKKMKQEMGLDIQGLNEAPVKEKKYAGFCVAKGSNGDFKSDKSCQCGRSNTCATFKYPKAAFSSDKNLSRAARLSTDLANATMSGNLQKANLKSSQLSKSAAAVNKFRNDQLKDLKKDDPKMGQILKQASLLERSLNDKSVAAFKKMAPELASFEKQSGMLGGNSRSLSSKKSPKAGSKKNLSARDGQDSLTLPPTASATGTTSAKNDLKVNYDDQADQGEDINEEDQLFASFPDDPSRGRRLLKKTDGEEVNDNRNKSLFKIISKRYERTAFPLFFRKRKL